MALHGVAWRGDVRAPCWKMIPFSACRRLKFPRPGQTLVADGTEWTNPFDKTFECGSSALRGSN
jgi:hypothetical protein